MTQPTAPSPAPPREQQPQLRRTPRQKVVSGVCGGLGRYCDIDPVIFRIVIAVLAVMGGVGLIVYGFAWLMLPLDGEEENEARRALSGRVDGAALIAVLMALLGCALFLSMIGNGTMLGFAAMLSIAMAAAAVWSQRRSLATSDGGRLDPATAHAVKEAPPETKAPPAPGGPSWWRDPIVKDGSTGPVATGYLWGPPEAVAADRTMATPRQPGVRGDGDHAQEPISGRFPGPVGGPAAAPPRGPRGIGGPVFLLALLAGALGARLSWESKPLGTSLEIGFACALAVFCLGLLTSSLLGRRRGGTILLTVVTALLLFGSSLLPKEIGTRWMRTDWQPTTIAAIAPRYELGSGDARLDLGGLAVPARSTVNTTVEVGAGRLRVVIPQDATVKITAKAGLGVLRLSDEHREDVDVGPDRRRTVTLSPAGQAAGKPGDRPDEKPAPTGTLTLDLEVGLGLVEVTRAMP
ncbi:PspC domain-containing protein [Streptomyces sp. SCSIO 30461]|uniref:PspC domain-containing protein n=1 Tax=Streptomyces sp. SCSIO 30461 TaxID=3118085 RepID=UPI0030CD3B65